MTFNFMCLNFSTLRSTLHRELIVPSACLFPCLKQNIGNRNTSVFLHFFGYRSFVLRGFTEHEKIHIIKILEIHLQIINSKL